MNEHSTTAERIREYIRAVMPNRINKEWGLVVPGNTHQVQPIRGGFQFIGGRTWTISFLRIVPEDTVRAYHFYDRAEDTDATS